MTWRGATSCRLRRIVASAIRLLHTVRYARPADSGSRSRRYTHRFLERPKEGHLRGPATARLRPRIEKADEQRSPMTESSGNLAFDARWFETALVSIGDAVIATDHQGRVLFLNPMAQA